MQKKCRNTQKIPQIAEWKYAKHGNENLPKLEMKILQMTERKLHKLPNEKVTNDRIKNKSFGKSKRCEKTTQNLRKSFSRCKICNNFCKKCTNLRFRMLYMKT